MKYVKSYKIFESIDDQFLKTYEEVVRWLGDYDIGKYTINKDLTVDVDGDVDLDDFNLKYLPVQFGKVNGYFFCDKNNLNSLKGCPIEIKEEFACSVNEIYNLDGFPKNIGSTIFFDKNPISNFFKLIKWKYVENDSAFSISDKMKSDNRFKKFIEYLIEYNVIINKTIHISRLKDALYMIDEDENFDYKKLYTLKDYKILE